VLRYANDFAVTKYHVSCNVEKSIEFMVNENVKGFWEIGVS
jgi:hypothetical protein